MGANKEKQNLRYKKTAHRLDKKERYDGFTPEEVKVIKAKKKMEQFEHSLNEFWATAPRRVNNSVDWDKLSSQELDYFEHIDKEHKKALRVIVKSEDKGMDVDDVLKRFLMLNVRSVCY